MPYVPWTRVGFAGTQVIPANPLYEVRVYPDDGAPSITFFEDAWTAQLYAVKQLTRTECIIHFECPASQRWKFIESRGREGRVEYFCTACEYIWQERQARSKTIDDPAS